MWVTVPASSVEDPSYVVIQLHVPTVNGALTSAQVLAEVMDRDDEIRACCGRAASPAERPEGTVSVQLEIGPEGRVSGSSVTTEGRSSVGPVERCIADELASLIFPAPGGEGATVLVPIGVTVLAEPEPRDYALLTSPVGDLEVGAAAPELGLEGLLGAPEGADVGWEALRGKVVVLEFWATWCGPCHEEIPHLAELSRDLTGDDVVILSITDEDEATVRPFLERRPMAGWIGLDTDGSVLRDYQIRGIPIAVVVDGRGRIAEITHPSSLTADGLRRLVESR